MRWHLQLELKPVRLGGRSPVALSVRLDDGSGLEVTEQGTEKRLAVYLVRDIAAVQGVARLGMDPLDPGLDVASLRQLLRERPAQLKAWLTDQTILAGVGNAYSDEVLHAAHLSPFRRSTSLDPDEVERLHRGLRDVLEDAVRRSASLPAGDLKAEKRAGMAVHGRTGQPCSVCGDMVREISLAHRSFQYCPTCQTGGRVLNDRRLSLLLK